MRTRIIFGSAVILLFSLTTSAFAAEHPTYQTTPKQSSVQGAQAAGQTELDRMRNDRTAKAAEEKPVSTAQLSAGIKREIASVTKKSTDRRYHVKDQGKDLALALVKVHDDRLSNLGGGKYFACVDMNGADGKTYDIDFFLAGTADNMRVTETSVHKINGKPLYGWKEQGGVWKKVATK